MSYQYIYEYIPSRYVGLSFEQQNARNIVYQFKDGNCPENVKQQFLTRIRNIANGLSGEVVVCFIPASTKAKTANRYASLASFLSIALSGKVSVAMDAIVLTQDHEAGHLNGSLQDPTQYFSFNSSLFKGKNVILIDDVITRGRSFNDTRSKMLNRGAKNVTGLFLAKTIHPDLPIREGKPMSQFEAELLDEIYGEETLDIEDILGYNPDGDGISEFFKEADEDLVLSEIYGEFVNNQWDMEDFM